MTSTLTNWRYNDKINVLNEIIRIRDFFQIYSVKLSWIDGAQVIINSILKLISKGIIVEISILHCLVLFLKFKSFQVIELHEAFHDANRRSMQRTFVFMNPCLCVNTEKIASCIMTSAITNPKSFLPNINKIYLLLKKPQLFAAMRSVLRIQKSFRTTI